MKRLFLLLVMISLPALAVQTVTLTNVMKDGKKTWTPGTVTAKKGKVKFVLKNTLDAPHGFHVPGVHEPVVVMGKKTMEVSVDIKKNGTYKLICHMHPAHVGSKLEVK